MELLSQVKALGFIKKLLLGEVNNILPFNSTSQKGPCCSYTGKPLKREIPENVGIPSLAIEKFIRTLDTTPMVGLHSLIIARGDKIVTEASWAPYTTKKWHVTHSLCKSVTGTAIGMLCDEGLLSINDKICDIFPEKCSLLTGRKTRQITVEHLLTMTSGASFKELGALIEVDWVKAYFESDIAFEPGTKFDYNSMNSYILSAIITKKTGSNIAEYLKPRLFEPLGFGQMVWETCPQGINKGGWGLYVYLEDLVKLGILYMNGGSYEGKQLLSKEWAKKAVSSLQTRESGEEYGYHIWASTKNKCFMFNGMFGQYIIVFPEKNITIAMNAGNGHLFTQSLAFEQACKFASIINSFEPLEENFSANKALQSLISSLCLTKGVYTLKTEKEVNWIKRFLNKNKKDLTTSLKINDYDKKSFILKKNTAGLLPIMLQCICGSFGLGVNEISFAAISNSPYLVWTEGNIKTLVPLCFEKPANAQINLNGFMWDIGTTAIFKKDEDDNDVLKISISFLESSSTRLIKIIFHNDNSITVKLDESPAIALAMEKIKSENVTLTKIDPTFFKDIEFVEYKITRFCAPTLKSI